MMARKKNDSLDQEKDSIKQLNNASVPGSERAIEDRLRDAEGSINRASDESKTRDDEMAKRRREEAKEKRAKALEAEKQKRAAEKEMRKQTEAKLAELEYAESYRKKLQKEKQRAEEERKLAEREAKDAERKAADEASAKRIADILEAERNDARRRSERAEALLNHVTNRGAASDAETHDGLENEQQKLDDAVLKAIKQAEVTDNTGEAPETALIGDGEAEDTAGDENAAAEEAYAEDATDVDSDDNGNDATDASSDDASDASADDATDASADDAASGADDTITVSFGESFSEEPLIDIVYSDGSEPDAAGEVVEEDEEDDDNDSDDGMLGDVAKWFARSGVAKNITEVENTDAEERDDGEAEDAYDDDYDDPLDEIPSSNSGIRKNFDEGIDGLEDDYRGIPRRKKKRREPPITDELLEQNDIVKEIRAQGKKLRNTRRSLKSYADNSRKAIIDYTKALKEGRRALDNSRDERHTPEIIINLMKISAKIIEICCDNLENYARLKATAYIKNARVLLRSSISEYNELAISYSVLTGEQLTRFSTLLPDNIAAGKVLAVIPDLSYKESYVQVYPDEDGNIPNEDGAVLTTVIPVESADTIFAPYDARAFAFGFGSYVRRAKQAIKYLGSHTGRIVNILSKVTEAERKCKNELRALERDTPIDQRDSDKYRLAVLRVRFKYGKLLTSLKTSRVKYAFAKTKARFLVGCLSVEREKLAVAYRLLREAYKKGKSSHKEKAEAIFSEVVASYNRYARQCEEITGTAFDTLPPNILERVRKSRGEYVFPIVAYRRELVETVGSTSRKVSMALKESLEANESAYTESSRMVLDGSRGLRDRVSLTDEAPMVDRASSIAKLVIDTLREYAESVDTGDGFTLYMEKSARAVKYFKKSLKRTEIAISKAYDDNGVVAALVENLRVIANIIEVRRINIALATRVNRGEFARSESRALYKEIELYNGRAIDYMSIVGEQFTRITTLPINALTESADKLRVPIIGYKDNYIEVFPKDPLEEELYEKPTQRRGGYYTPLLMKHFRLTENRSVETTVVNAPFVFDVAVDDMPVVSWWHPTNANPFVRLIVAVIQPIIAAFLKFRTHSKIWFIQTSLTLSKSGLDNRDRKSENRRKRLEAKLVKLEKEKNHRLLALSSTIHDSDRHTAEYHRRLNKINTYYSKKICKVKLRWMQECPAQTKTRWMLERLVLNRELLIGVNKLLIKFRNYGRITFSKNALVGYKAMFLDAINEHNETARELSKLVGVEFSEVSTTVAEEIVRYGNVVRFPQIVCCREIIETIGSTTRSVGDKWHGYGIYTRNPGGSPSGAPPAMSVGAMGYSTEMGIPYFNADFNSMSLIGMTPKGVPLIGFTNSGEAAVPFSGIPMMMKGEDDSPVLDAGLVGANGLMVGGVNAANPYSSINSGAVDAIYVDNIEQKAKNGVTIETPIDIETAMVEERFLRALGARAMTTVDGVKTWWKLIGSEINLMIQRNLFLDKRGFLRILLPDDDEYLENIITLVPGEEKWLLARISKLSSIIDVEISRLYSATKAGIRRSQRKFSAWLTRDIELYNRLVDKYNKLASNPNHSEKRRENEKLRPLSYSIPDNIRHRLDDRPPSPPHFKFRNRVRTAPFGWSKVSPNKTNKKQGKHKVQRITDPIDTHNMIDRLYEFVNANWYKHSRVVRVLFKPVFFVKKQYVTLLHYLYRKHNFVVEGILVKKLRKEVDKRTQRTYARRRDNEARHYYIRYEKARAMKRYNKRMLCAVGTVNDPIRYHKRVHGVLRRYVSTNFRIDYNMRIYQLLERALRISRRSYYIVLLPMLLFTVFAGMYMDRSVFACIAFITACWGALPTILSILWFVYKIVYLAVYIVRLMSGNKQMLPYGAKDVESNRYGLVLDCFICEQYKILAYAASVAHNPSKKMERMKLISVINDYNKRKEEYSKILRVNITSIEPTAFIDKLLSKGVYPLTEIQNFYYVRELVQVNGTHDVGKNIDAVEMIGIKERLNRYIGYVGSRKTGLSYDELQEFTDNLEEFIDRMKKSGIDTKSKSLADSVKAALAGFDFITLENRAIYRDTLTKLVVSTSGKKKRRKLAESLTALADEVAVIRDVISDEAVERFENNTRRILNERAKDAPNLSDEERFRLKEEIVSFVEKYPVDGTVIREEVARDFIKFIDDVGGTPERVIITSLALDNMIY